MRVRGSAAAAALLLFAAGCASVPTAGRREVAATPAGKSARAVVHANWKEAPLAGAVVEWRTGIPGAAGETVLAAPTGADGVASAELPPGRYFLLAHWRQDADYGRAPKAGDRFAFFGGNPVILSAGPPREIFVALSEVPPPPPPAAGEDAATGGVAGVVLGDGEPLSDAHVFAYLRTESAFRDMGFAASAPTGTDGSFFLDLPPGRYWLVARKRASGSVAGPLRKGDSFGYYPSNPVEIAEGALSPARLAIPASTLRLRNAPSYSADAKASSFIEGRILGADGKPRSGVYAALYDNPDLLNRPLFLSDVTGDDGHYRLPVAVPGVYYLGARSGYGGSPSPGDLYGRFEGNAGHTVTVREGDRLTGVDLVVSEVR